LTTNALLFFVKFPEPGKVKTRLAAEVGDDRAAAIYRELVAAVCAGLPAGCDVIVQFDPPDKMTETEQWLRPSLPAATFAPQCAGDLGARLEHAFSHAFSLGYRRLAVIGSDCVEIDADLFSNAFAQLETHDAVIGPSADGGYYLLALKTPQPALFEQIAWSSAQTLEHTLERASGMRIAMLPQLRDVDTESDWKIAERFLRSADRVTASGEQTAN
jgi:rSAM/selenodomain-associated transferase 1